MDIVGPEIGMSRRSDQPVVSGNCEIVESPTIEI